MGFESGPSFEQKDEVTNMNRGYNLIENVKEQIESGDFSDIAEKIEKIREVEKFVDVNLPEISEELSKEEENSAYGYYSPSHMMANTLKLMERVISGNPAEEGFKAVTAADQAMRLMSYGMKEKRLKVSNHLSGRESYETFDLPNLLEIPSEWKNSPAGKDFTDKLKDFILRRHNRVKADQRDQEILSSAASLIFGSCKAQTFNKAKVEHAPYARELILINLDLLAGEVHEYQGRELPGNKENNLTFQMIRGLYNYEDGHEINRQLKPNWEFVNTPAIIKQPSELRT